MSEPTTTSRRVWIAVGCAVALVIGIGMAYWQWSRYESASGTLQNLGYVLQWPLFGIFPAFMVWRIWKVARRERAIDRADTHAEDTVEPAESVAPTAQIRRSKMAYVPPSMPQDKANDPALAEYNAMLAQLNDEKQE